VAAAATVRAAQQQQQQLQQQYLAAVKYAAKFRVERAEKATKDAAILLRIVEAKQQQQQRKRKQQPGPSPQSSGIVPMWRRCEAKVRSGGKHRRQVAAAQAKVDAAPRGSPLRLLLEALHARVSIHVQQPQKLDSGHLDADSWEPFDDMQLANGITAAVGWMDMAVDPSLEIVGLPDEGWEETTCFEVVRDVKDYLHIHAKVCPSAGAVRERILKAQRQFGLKPAGLRDFQQDANRKIPHYFKASKNTNSKRPTRKP
tara:strand:- start:156 stop:926 length:771 start_codon:yes stop_codon:yes gene_type:complete